MEKVVLITGASRGLGKGVAEALVEDNYLVYAGIREFSSVSEVSFQENLKYVQLDVSNNKSIEKCTNYILSKHGKLDVLVNNAGVYLDDMRSVEKCNMLDLDPELFSQMMKVNVEGPLNLIWKILPFMKENNFGRIINVSSGMGRFEDFDKQAPFYRISKTALNALTVVISKEIAGLNILVNSVCPGWVATDMGGEAAPRSVQQGIKGIIEAVKYPEDGPNGMFLRDGQPLNWCNKL